MVFDCCSQRRTIYFEGKSEDWSVVFGRINLYVQSVAYLTYIVRQSVIKFRTGSRFQATSFAYEQLFSPRPPNSTPDSLGSLPGNRSSNVHRLN